MSLQRYIFFILPPHTSPAKRPRIEYFLRCFFAFDGSSFMYAPHSVDFEQIPLQIPMNTTNELLLSSENRAIEIWTGGSEENNSDFYFEFGKLPQDEHFIYALNISDYQLSRLSRHLKKIGKSILEFLIDIFQAIGAQDLIAVTEHVIDLDKILAAAQADHAWPNTDLAEIGILAGKFATRLESGNQAHLKRISLKNTELLVKWPYLEDEGNSSSEGSPSIA